MQASQSPTLVPLAFAANGNKNTIPEPSQLPGNPGAASLNDGFPPATMTPLAAGGTPMSGPDLNGILNLLSQTVRWKNAGGQFAYNSTFAGDTNVGGYPQGAELMRADLTGWWINAADNNATNPDAIDGSAANWVPGYNYGVTTVSGLTNANVTLYPVQAAKTRIVLSGTLTGNVQIIFPTWLKDWKVTNNTSGSFTVTCKTASGLGAVCPQGVTTAVYGDGVNINFDNPTWPSVNTTGNVTAAGSVTAGGKINGVNSPNLLFNGSGEFGNAGWQSSNFGALVGGSGEGTLFSNASPIVASTVDSANPFAIAAGVPLALSAWAYTGGMTAGAAEVDVQFFNSSMVSVGFASSRLTFAPGQGFTYLWTTFTAPAGTAYACVRKYADASVGSPAAVAFGVRFGRIKLESGTTPSFYSPEASIAGLGFAHGQCRLTVASATSLNLLPYNGNSLIINSVPQQIPAAGVTVTNAGLIASAWYYVYAYMNGATMALECSSTGYVASATGVKVKSSDATRTLVGAIYTNLTSPNFVDNQAQRFCLSYFNRQSKYLAVGQSNINFTNTTVAEISTSLRANFISWADESVQASASGEISTSAGSISITYQQAIDGNGGQLGDFSGTWFTNGGVGNPFISNNGAQVTEGVLHYLTIVGGVNTGTGTILQGYSRGMIRG